MTIGLVELVVAIPFDAALERTYAAIEGAAMAVFARIDHAEAARSVGLSMPPTVVLIYGNPRGGTPVMVAAPRVALDLPLRVALRGSLDGHTVISYQRIRTKLDDERIPEDLVRRLEAGEEVIGREFVR